MKSPIVSRSPAAQQALRPEPGPVVEDLQPSSSATTPSVPDGSPRHRQSTRSRVVRFLLGALMAATMVEGATHLLVNPDLVLRWHDHATQLKISQLEQIVDQSGPVDTVIIGTSMAQQGLVPSALAESEPDHRFYNAALNGGVPVVMESWLLDQIAPRTEPRRVIWGLSPIDLSSRYGDATEEAYRTAPATRSGALAALDRAVSRHSRFVSARARLRDPSALWGSERTADAQQLAAAASELGADGERRNYTTDTSAERAAEINDRLEPFTLDPDDLAAIIRTVDNLQSHDIEIVLVELPVPPRLVALSPDGAQTTERFSKTLQELADELDIQLISPTSAATADAQATAARPAGIDFTDSDFVDFTHLNEAGADRFTRQVAAALADRSEAD